MPYLLALGGDQNGRFFDLSAGVTVGTDRTCDVHLRDSRVSWRHARVQADDASALVEDLGSSDGTFVNGQLVDRAELQEGDIVETGGSRFAFLAAVPEGAQAPPRDVLRPASQEIKQLREKIEELVAERTHDGTRLTAQLDVFRSERQALESELRDARSKIQAAEAEATLYKNEAARGREELMESKRSARESAARDEAALEETVARLQEELKASQRQREAVASRCLELEQQIQHLDASLRETKGEGDVTATRRQELEKKMQRVEETLRQTQGERDDALSHGEASAREIAELRGQLAVAEERILNFVSDLDDVRRELAENARKAVEDRESLQAEHGRALDDLRASLLADAKRAREETAKLVREVELKARDDLDSYRKRRDEEEARRSELFDRERDALKEEIERAKSQFADQLAQTETLRAETERVRSEREELLMREQDRRHQDLLKAEEVFRGRERDWQRLYAKDAERARRERDEVAAERDRFQENVKNLLGELRQAQLELQSREKDTAEEEARLRAELRDAETSSAVVRREHEKRVREIQEMFDQRFAEHAQASEAERSAWATTRRELAEKLEAAAGLQQSTASELDETRSLLEEVQRRADEAAATIERRDVEHRAAIVDLEANYRTELAELSERLRTEFSERERALARDRSDAEAAMAAELGQLRDYVDDLKARILRKEEELREQNQDFFERVATSASAVLRRQGVVQVPVPTASLDGNGVDEGREGV